MFVSDASLADLCCFMDVMFLLIRLDLAHDMDLHLLDVELTSPHRIRQGSLLR